MIDGDPASASYLEELLRLAFTGRPVGLAIDTAANRLYVHQRILGGSDEFAGEILALSLGSLATLDSLAGTRATTEELVFDSATKRLLVPQDSADEILIVNADPLSPLYLSFAGAIAYHADIQSIDDLAIKARYLDYKYGGALEDQSPADGARPPLPPG